MSAEINYSPILCRVIGARVTSAGLVARFAMGRIASGREKYTTIQTARLPMTKWTVWVGGVEVNAYLINDKSEAVSLAQYWIEEGYDDVIVEEVANVGL